MCLTNDVPVLEFRPCMSHPNVGARQASFNRQSRETGSTAAPGFLFKRHAKVPSRTPNDNNLVSTESLDQLPSPAHTADGAGKVASGAGGVVPFPFTAPPSLFDGGGQDCSLIRVIHLSRGR